MARATAQQVIMEILRCADGEFSGRSRLSKAFYFAQLDYFDKNPDTLTSWPLVRTPQGPGLHDSATLFDSLLAEGLLEIEPIHEYVYPEYRFRATEKGRRQPRLDLDAAASIQRAVEFVKDKSAAALSQLTREHSRSWNEAEDGEILDIYIDLIPEVEYRRRTQDISDLQARMEQLLAATQG